VTLDYTTATAPPVVNVIWPQDQMAVSGTSLTIRGTMSDETGTILAQVTDANHNVTPVPGLVERNNMFWIENVPLNATGEHSHHHPGHRCRRKCDERPADGITQQPHLDH